MSRSAPTIRLLAPYDASAYRSLRLRALREHPAAFTSSAEDEAVRPLNCSEERLTADASKPHDFLLGAFQDDVLLGTVGLQGRYRPKERHNATVVGMFVAPEGARRGLGMALMQDLLARARALPGLEQVDLTVTEGNDQAQRLYARCGFTVYGVLPHAIKVDGHDHAKVLMTLRLR
ncbi:MAG: GNAT family N-acetyltransferase [Rhodoferax sp.]|nr:GNAT family N-acetyltransferase [Rhodoferax sp.]